jgi:hypothetical protein
MPTITIYTFDGVASTGAARPYDPVKNPSGGFPAELATKLVAADSSTWGWTPIDYSPGQILNYEPFGAALDRGLSAAVEQILSTPGKVVLSGYSQGSLLATAVYNEFRLGSLQSRQSDLIGIFNFGDATRPAGWTVPLYGSRDPGGTGAMTLTYKQTYGYGPGLVSNPESLYWSFANIGDQVAAASSGMQPTLSQVIRRILYSGTESPTKLIFHYGEDGTPNSPPKNLLPWQAGTVNLVNWANANQATAQAAGTYKGQSVLDLIIALVGNSSVVSTTGLISLLAQWWPLTGANQVWSFINPLLTSTAFNPHTRYSGLFPYTGLRNNSKTAVALAFDHLNSLSKRYLPTALPITNSKADKPYQFYTFGKTGDFYTASGGRTTTGSDGTTYDIRRADIDYAQVSYGAEIAKKLDPNLIEWVPVSYASAAFPLRLCIQSAVDKAVRMILETPSTTKFFLSGNGVGAAVSSRLYDEFRSGRLQSRSTKLLGVYNYGNPLRQFGAYRSSADPGGHGMAGAEYRLSGTDPSAVWEFANPGDLVAIEPDGQQGEWAAALFSVMNQNATMPSTLKAQISESVIRPNNSDPNLISFTLETLNMMFGPAGQHNDYQNFFPFGNVKNSVQLSVDNINAIIGASSPSSSSTNPDSSVITPAKRASLMNTRTYFCVPDAQSLSEYDLSRIYDGIKRSNIDYVRIPISWNSIQPSRNILTTDSWISSDAAINKALEQNLQPMLVISPPFPSWTSSTSPQDIVPFIAALVTRYKPGGSGISSWNTGRGILEYQIWNEQNTVENWPTSVSALRYVNLLKVVYPKIKEIQPSATVIFGGLQACNTAFPKSSKSRNPINVDAVTYLKDCYARGIKGFFDVMAYHPLSVGTRQIPRPAAPNARLIAEADRLRAVMVLYGEEAKPIYWTQVGYDTAIVTPLQQQNYLDTFRWFSQTRSWLTGLGIYSYRDSTTTGVL